MGLIYAYLYYLIAAEKESKKGGKGESKGSKGEIRGNINAVAIAVAIASRLRYRW